VPQPETLPRVVDRYELVSVLGSGGFATVYHARHVHTQQDVAVKILHPRDPESDRWLGEARAAAAVQHRNVVRVLDCGRSGDDVFIVMDLVSGPTLAQVLAEQGPMPIGRAVGIAAQLLDGLAVAHARGIVHRDIKPPNVILTRDETGAEVPKILDFGVSKQLTEMSRTLDGTAIGTPGYMAPELFGGARHADTRADVYAIAATLYEMLSGKLPFVAPSYEELVVQVATRRPEPLLQIAPHVPPEIAATVDRGLARDRDARWATAEQFAAALRGALVGITPPSSQPFEATMMAAGVPSPRVPTLPMPDPTTMRTAPPPVVHTADRTEARSRASLGWVVGVAGVAFVAAAGGVIAGWRFLRPSASSAAAPPSTQAVATSPPREDDHSLDPPPEGEPAPLNAAVTAATATTPAAATPPAPATHEHETVAAPTTRGGIEFTFPPRVVGQVRATAVDGLARRVVPQAQRCRPHHGGHAVLARVQLFVQKEGTISIAQPASEPGDEGTARCLATLLKEAAKPATFSPGGGGIVTLEAKLAPR
jgi:hypothetical protein